MAWAYGPATYAGSRTQREVQSRTLTMNAGGPQYTYTMSQRDSGDSSRNVHLYAMLDDPDGQSEKVWWFQTDTSQSNIGLVTSFESRLSQSHVAHDAAGSHHEDYGYSSDNAGDLYMSYLLITEDTYLSTEVQKQSTQTLDPGGNGNVTQTQQYAWGNFTTPARTITNTYLTNNTNYTSRFIFNRLLTSTVTDGTNTATLVTNSYDGSGVTTLTGLHEHDDANYPASFNYRGNLTSSTTPTSGTSMLYDMTGYVRSTTTNGVTSTVATTSSTNYAAPSQITTNSLSSSMNWSSFLGPSSATGPNGDSGSVVYDGNARPSSTTSPYGAVTTYTYNTTTVPFSVVATTNGHWTSTLMDGFGRTIETATGYGATVVSKTDTNYTPCGCSPLGKVNGQSQPYAPGAMVYWTMYYYDGLGRTTSQVAPDGSTTTYSYAGAAVGVNSPTPGTWKQYSMDAFGNLTFVTEPDPGLGNVNTQYVYDILNHLIQVIMPRGSTTQYRTFNYNVGTPATTVTGFLQSASNPENGTVSYTYNANNLLATKTDAKSQTLTYAYDTYNRLTSVSAGSTVLRTYYYDTNPLQSGFSQNPLGRLTAVQYPALGSDSPHPAPIQLNDMYSYTQAGLPATKRLQVNQTYYWTVSGNGHQAVVTDNLDSTYTYNNEGKITAMTYPSTVSGSTTTPGASYNYSYDQMYRLSGMTSGSTTVVNGVSYNAANQLLTMNYPGANESRWYNVLNQLTCLNNGSGNLMYTYPTGTNNGKIGSMYNAVSGETVTYTYDSLNRLLTANGSGWNETYGYDGFGSLVSKSGSPANQVFSVDPTTNRLGGTDANGNAGSITNGSTTVSLYYDAENRMNLASTNGGGQSRVYAYDAQNRRIYTSTGAADSNGDPTNYAVNVYSPGGQKLGAYNISVLLLGQSPYTPTMQVALTSSDQYFGARRLAPMDQLGSAGNNNSSAGTYYPWGEPKGSTNPQDAWSYATYWTDSFSSLDYANNRYYSNAYGRFMTPDPYNGSSKPSKPQSWNRYAYVNGDPVNGNDPSGLGGLALYFQIYDGSPGDGGGGGGGGDGFDGGFGFQDTSGYCDPSAGPGLCAPSPCVGADGTPMPGPGCPATGGTAPPPPPPNINADGVATSLEVINLSATPCAQFKNGSQGTFGFVLDITYQVLNQWRMPLDEAGLLPIENISNSPLDWGAAGIPGGYARLGPPTNAAGQFLDKGVGTCARALGVDMYTQSIGLTTNVGLPPATSMPWEYPARVNNWIDFTGASGTGFLTNGTDVNVVIN